MLRLVKSLVPSAVRGRIKDIYEDVLRRFPRKHVGLPKHGLSPCQVYPHGEHFFDILAETACKELAPLGVDRQTPIASIGSCFAEEVGVQLKRRGFNYLQVEKSTMSFSADWGRVYTIPNFSQIVDYSLDPDFPVLVEKDARGWIDPLRDYSAEASWEGKEEAETAIRAHRAKSREVFERAAVLTVTPGQNEAFYDRKHDVYWAHKPSAEIFERAPDRFEPRAFGYQQNLDTLKGALGKLLDFNPKLKVILTVSPVPAHATFCGENVVSESFAYKSQLRWVVHEVVSHFKDRVAYFPSFEMVLAYNPDSFKSDNRHVKHHVVGRIFDMLSSGLSG